MDAIHRHIADEFGPEYVECDLVWTIPVCGCGQVLAPRVVRSARAEGELVLPGAPQEAA
jgi:hypothetical protein